MIDAAFAGILEQCREAIEPVYEFAVGHADKQAENETEMDGQQDAHRRRCPENQKQETGQAGQEQHPPSRRALRPFAMSLSPTAGDWH